MTEPGTDPLSSLAHDLMSAAAYDALVAPSRTPQEARQLLASIAPDQLLTVPIANGPAGHAMLCGLWLRHDALSECHEIAQKDHSQLQEQKGRSLATLSDLPPIQDMTPTLNFWHAIMHRREGDFSNSKYWYARCRTHPTLSSLTNQATQILHPLPADKRLLRLTNPTWEPSAFVDLVESVHERPGDPLHAAAVALQHLEWRLLFDHCTRAAAGQ